MEPPPIQINLVEIQRRDRTSIVRDYALDSYEAAVDALWRKHERQSGRAA